MIRGITLKNWKSHENTSLKFSSGVNLLVGAIGTGKTSVLDAISFAFFGTFPDLQSKKVKLDDVIMNRPFEKNEAVIELELEFNNKIYKIKRVIRKGEGTVYSEIRENGKLIEGPNPLRVNEVIKKILKLDYDTFYNVIYSDQNKIDYFLTLPRGQRKEKIDRILGIDKIEIARKSCVTLRGRIVNRIAEKRIIVKELESQNLHEKYSTLANEIKGLKEKKQMLINKLEIIKLEIEKIKEEKEKLEKIKENLENLEKEYEKQQAILEQLKKEIKEISSLVSGLSKENLEIEKEMLDNEIRKLKEELQKIKEEFNSIISSISSLKMEKEYLSMQLSSKKLDLSKLLEKKNEVEKIFSEFGNIEQKISETEKEINFIFQKIVELSSLISFEENNIATLEKSENKCPVCNANLSKEKIESLIKEKREIIAKSREKIDELEKIKFEKERFLVNLKEKSKKLSLLLEEIKKIESVEKEISEINEKLDKIPKKLEEMYVKEKMVKKEIEEKEKILEEKIKEKIHVENLLQKIHDFENKQKRKEEIERKIFELYSKISELRKVFNVEKLKEIERTFLELSKQEASLSKALESLAELIIEKEKRLKEIKEKIDLLEKYKKEISRLEKYVSDLEILEKALKESQEIIRREFIEVINYFMDAVWKVLYPYKDFTSLRLLIDENDYVLQLKDSRGIWINVDGIASGGERTLACLSLRIAMARALVPHLRWLILDEPTHNLDEKAVQEFSVLLNEKISEFIDQLFIITHNEKLEEIVNGVIYKFTRDKILDKPTKVTQVI